MKRCGDEQERIKHWTRVEAERELLANRTERGLIGAAVALKGFQLSGQFPDLRIPSEVNSSLVH